MSAGTRNQETTNQGTTKKGTTKGTTNKGTADRATPKPGTAPRGTAGPVVPRSRSPWRRIVRLVLALLLAVAVLFAAAAIGTYYGSRQAGRAPVDGLGGFPQKLSPTAYFVPVR